jgi:hypothetical protein
LVEEAIAKRDMEQLQGEWVCVSVDLYPHPDPRQISGPRPELDLELLDATGILRFEGEYGYGARLKLRPCSKEPAFQVTTMHEKLSGTYKIQGDSLWLCFNESRSLGRIHHYRRRLSKDETPLTRGPALDHRPDWPR